MKKIFRFTLLMFIICMTSCNNKKDEPTPMVTISFNQQIVSGNSMTRATTNEFLDIIKEQTPSYVNVTLKNLDLNKTYTCTSNETITIPIGNYAISAKIDGAHQPVGTALWYNIYKTPFLKCNTFTYNITHSTNSITLDTYYNCYAIFALIDECKSCTTVLDGETAFFNKFNKYYICYFQDSPKVTLTPYDDSTEFITTTYNFSTTYDVNKVFAEYGKYYVIHPQKVDKSNCGFNINLIDMIEGDI